MTKDREFLLQALSLAKKRRGYTYPNPAVGAVVVKNNEVVGTGFHWGSGLPHAEVEALKNLGEEANGATIYVTLEPCCHFGKTPPCTELIKEKKLRRVVYAFQDPNPVVLGKGASLLKEAGISVERVSQNEVTEFYQPYSWWVKNKKTWLSGKLAFSKNGNVSTGDGKPIKITGQDADTYTHFRRSEADLILTSEATLKADNPRLDVRFNETTQKKPVWVLDRELNFSLDYQVMKTASTITLVHGASAEKSSRNSLEQSGVACIEMTEKNKGLVLSDLAAKLAEKGYHEAWVEVGPKLFSVFLQEKLFQEVILFQSHSVNIIDGKPAFIGKREVLFESYRKVGQDKLGADSRERWVLK